MSADEQQHDDGFTPDRAMVIAAHPDDIEFGSAGTVAKWVRAGAQVAYVLCTSGDVGIDEPGMTRERATEIREVEQRAAAETIGVTDVTFLREPDGMLENTMDLRRRLVRQVRRFRPEAVITLDPTVLFASETYVNHPDHRAAGTAAIDAVFPASGQPLVFPELADEGLSPHKVRRLYCTSFRSGDRVVDITETIDDKLRALRQHESQLGDWDPEPMLREWAENAAEGTPHRYVERFRVTQILSDEEWHERNSPNAEAEASDD